MSTLLSWHEYKADNPRLQQILCGNNRYEYSLFFPPFIHGVRHQEIVSVELFSKNPDQVLRHIPPGVLIKEYDVMLYCQVYQFLFNEPPARNGDDKLRHEKAEFTVEYISLVLAPIPLSIMTTTIAISSRIRAYSTMA